MSAQPQTRDDSTDSTDDADSDSDDVEVADAITGAPHMAKVLISKGKTLAELENLLNTDTTPYAALWATYPTFPEVNNEADDPTRHAQTFLFADALSVGDDTNDEDGLTFTVEYEYLDQKYNQTKVVVDTPNPFKMDESIIAHPDAETFGHGEEWDAAENEVAAKPNAVVKSLIWNEHHYNFQQPGDRGPANKKWVLEPSGVEPLREAVEATGYEWVDERGPDPDEYMADDGDAYDRLTDFAERGDTVTIHYEMANGNGRNTKTGVVIVSNTGDEENKRGTTPAQKFSIKRDDGNVNTVERHDVHGTGVYSKCPQSPYMGDPVAVEVIPGDGDDRPAV